VDVRVYQAEALKTCAALNEVVDQLNLGALGLAGETGEVVDHIKKFLYQGHAFDADKLVDEMGDVLWYIALLCHALGVTLDEVMEANVQKLCRRYPSGFDVHCSVNR
jgi:NTP pyrophosphatase (non-canonical NTP hydrolase)